MKKIHKKRLIVICVIIFLIVIAIILTFGLTKNRHKEQIIIITALPEENEYNSEAYAQEEVIKIDLVAESQTKSFRGYEFIPLNAELQSRIHELCAEYEIDYGLIISVIKTESEFQWVIGDNGQAVGYMQIWPYWWQDTADTYGLDIHNPLDNVHLGIIILADALDDNGGDLSKALKQYNSGNPNSESNHYVDRIYENYEWYERELLNETT